MDEIVLEAQGKMNKTIEILRQSLATLRTGKASPALLSNLQIFALV